MSLSQKLSKKRMSNLHPTSYEERKQDNDVKILNECKEKWMPTQWQEKFENIRKMRRNYDAPVDELGPQRYMLAKDVPNKQKRFYVLVSLMLSSQTKDEVNFKAMTRLIAAGLTPKNLSAMEEQDIGELIKPVGFWKRKSVYLKKTSKILVDSYKSDIPSNVNELIKLPGIGSKMAYIIMSCAWNEVVGIGVDVHIHRISNRLGWVKKPTSKPETTQKELEEWLPPHLWKEVGRLLVGFGQQICAATPKCQDCLNKDICPASKIST